MNNRNHTGNGGVYAGICITVAGILMIVVPIAIHMDGMDGGFALGLIGFFIAICGFITLLILGKRRKIRRRMLEGDILAAFKYGKDQWEHLVREEISETSGLKIMGIVLGIIFGIIGIVFLLADEDLFMPFVVMAVLAVFFLCLGFISSGARKRRIANCPPEAIITRDGVSYMGELLDWNGRTSILDAVGFHPVRTNTLIFSYRHLAGRYPRMVRSNLAIPIPDGMEDTAALVVQFFNLPLTSELLSEMSRDEG